MAKHVFIVLTNPVADREDEYNSWYTGTHLADILRLPGMVAAQRFKISNGGGGASEPQRYLCIYEAETDDVKGLHELLVERVATGEIVASDALDASTAFGAYYTPITERVTRQPAG